MVNVNNLSIAYSDPDYVPADDVKTVSVPLELDYHTGQWVAVGEHAADWPGHFLIGFDPASDSPLIEYVKPATE